MTNDTNTANTVVAQIEAARETSAEMVKVFAGVIGEEAGVKRYAVQIQPRTSLITRPAFFYLEPFTALRKNDSGNDHNQINKGVHQVDPNRRVGHAAMMPDVALARDTGNAYARDYLEAGDRCITSKAWLISVAVAHRVYQLAKEEGATFGKVAETVAAEFKEAGLSKSKARKIVSSTLRDLRTYGLANLGSVVLGDETTISLVNPAEVATLAEYEAAAEAAAELVEAAPADAAPAEEAPADAAIGETEAKASRKAKRATRKANAKRKSA